MQKRAPAASSSGQPSQPMKRPCCAPVNQEWKGSEMKLEPRSCLIEEDVQRVCGQNRDLAEFHSADCCQSCIGNALKHIVERMYSMEISFQKLREDLANIHYPHLVRANAKSMAKNDVRNLQLQFRTKLSLPLFTGKKIEGEGGARIEVALIDAKTGGVVTSGPESSIKLEVVVLEGDFNKDNWIQEEFENYVVKEREGKRPLLVGNLQVTLNEGVGQLGELTFTDNSSWNRSKSFRIGLRLASGYCGSARIREAKTDAFPVKEHRGESYMKRHPPVSDDEVWRLEKIAKDGKFHQKLSEAGIHKVEDFLLQHFIDSKKLKEILGKSITLKNWDILVDHAKTCKTNWKLYYTDGMRKHGAVFNTNRQLIALIKDSARFAAHQLSTQEKELGYTIVKEAFDNWNSVREFDGETFSDSVQKKSSSSSPSQVFEGQIENLTPVQCKLAQRICAAPVGLEAPPANASSTAERYTGVTALALPGQSEDTNSGNAMEVTVEDIFRFLERQPTDEDSLNVQNTIIGLPTQSHDINFQCQTIDSLSQMDHTENQNVLPFEPPDGSTSSSQFSSTLPLPEGNDEDFRSAISDDNIEDWFARFIRNLPDDYRFFQTPPDDDTFLQTVPYEYEDTFVRTPPYVYEDKFFQTPPDDDRLFEIPPYYDTFFQTPPYDDGGVRGTSVIVNGWLKIEAVMQWGFSIRKRGVRIVQLDEPSIEV